MHMKKLIATLLFALAPITQASAQIAQPLVFEGGYSYLEIPFYLFQPQDVAILHRELVSVLFVTIKEEWDDQSFLTKIIPNPGGGAAVSVVYGSDRRMTGVAVDMEKEHVYVMEEYTFGSAITVLDYAGTPLMQVFDSGLGMTGAEGIDVDLAGNVYVTDPSYNRVVKFSESLFVPENYGVSHFVSPEVSFAGFMYSTVKDVSLDKVGRMHVTFTDNHYAVYGPDGGLWSHAGYGGPYVPAALWGVDAKQAPTSYWALGMGSFVTSDATHRYRWLDPIGTSTYAGIIEGSGEHRGCESARMTSGTSHKYIYAVCKGFSVRWYTDS